MKLNIKDIALLKSNPLEYYKKSYSHKPHLGDLPYDLNTNDPDKLKERLKACKEGLKEAEKELKDLQEFKDNVESVEQYNKEVQEDAKKQLGYINNTWQDVQKEAERFDDLSDEGWIYEWYSAMGEFMEEMSENPGFITNEIEEKYEALYGIEEYDPERYADEESGYPSPMYGAWGFEAYLEDREKLQNEIIGYMGDFNIEGNGKHGTEMQERMDKLPNDWEEKNNTINREIGKVETKVNDFKNHQQRIEEKLDNLKE